MPADTPIDAKPVLAALLHKLGSPLGAVANYSYLLEGGDAAEAIDGIQSGVGRAKTLMAGARRWIRAFMKFQHPKLIPVDWTVRAKVQDDLRTATRATVQAPRHVTWTRARATSAAGSSSSPARAPGSRPGTLP